VKKEEISGFEYNNIPKTIITYAGTRVFTLFVLFEFFLSYIGTLYYSAYIKDDRQSWNICQSIASG